MNGTFDPAAAEAVAAQSKHQAKLLAVPHEVLIHSLSVDLPESTALPAASQTINTKNPSSQSTVRGGTVSSSPTAAGDNSRSGSKKTNAGAIAGGVVGGLAGVALIAAAVFVLRRRARRSALPVGTQTHTIYSPNAQSWEKSPVISVSTHKLYVRHTMSSVYRSPLPSLSLLCLCFSACRTRTTRGRSPDRTPTCAG